MLIQRSQSGLALLIFVVILLGSSLVLLSGSLIQGISQQEVNKKKVNIDNLKEAKEALLSYSLKYRIDNKVDEMGILPCPDVKDVSAIASDVEGISDGACGTKGVNTVGYFPYKTIGIGKAVDAYQECLWYVVSGNYKNEPYGLLNRDSNGYLNLVDENGLFQHGTNPDDYPLALIISPGKNIDQDRDEVTDLRNCKANYNIDEYLEFFTAGAQKKYSTELANTSDTDWEVLQPSASSLLESVGYNDQVIALYRDEFWDVIQRNGDLDFDTTALIPPSTAIENLTRSLAECIAAYGNNGANIAKLLPYPSPVDINVTNTLQDEYSNSNNYDDDATILQGRFPQNVNSSLWNDSNFVSNNGPGTSYCEPPRIATAYDEDFWENWKDHFFLVVSDDFQSNSVVTAGAKCSGAGASVGCITVDNKVNDRVAAMVIYSGHAEAGVDRNWHWDSVNNVANIDNKSLVSNYLEGDNSITYAGAFKNINLVTTDYAYCVEYDATFILNVIKCADLDNVF